MTFARPPRGGAHCLWVLALTLIEGSASSGVLAGDPDPPVLTDATTIEQSGMHVSALGFSPDGTRLALAAGHESLQVFDVATRKRVLRVGDVKQNFDDSIREFAVAPEGKTLALGETCRTEERNIAYAGRVRLADAATGKLLKKADFEWPTQALAHTPDGKLLAVGFMSGEVHLLDPATLASRRLFRDPKQAPQTRRRDIAHIAFNPEGSCLALAFYSMRGPHEPPPDPDTEIHIWDVAAGKLVHRLLNPKAGGANSVAFAPRGAILAAGYSEGKVCLWDTSTGKLTATYGDGAARVGAVAFSPDSRLLVEGGYKPALRVWEAGTGKLLFKHDTSEALPEVVSLAFSRDGKRLAAGSSHRTVVLWKVAPGGKTD